MERSARAAGAPGELSGARGAVTDTILELSGRSTAVRAVNPGAPPAARTMLAGARRRHWDGTPRIARRLVFSPSSGGASASPGVAPAPWERATASPRPPPGSASGSDRWSAVSPTHPRSSATGQAGQAPAPLRAPACRQGLDACRGAAGRAPGLLSAAPPATGHMSTIAFLPGSEQCHPSPCASPGPAGCSGMLSASSGRRAPPGRWRWQWVSAFRAGCVRPARPAAPLERSPASGCDAGGRWRRDQILSRSLRTRRFNPVMPARPEARHRIIGRPRYLTPAHNTATGASHHQPPPRQPQR